MKSLKQRFWSKVNKSAPNGCWEWTGCRDKDGYGKLEVVGKTVQAHRFSYIMKYGQVIPGLLVCHTCDNPPCVNPNHLFVGTKKDNNSDCRNKNRQFQPSEEKGKNRVLTPDKVRGITAMCRLGLHTQLEIAHHFGITQSQVSRIKNRRHWKYIPV